MEISISTAKGKRPITVMQSTGEISSYNYQALEEKARQLHTEGMKDLLIDMKGVTFVSSGGIRALTMILKMLHTPPSEGSEKVSHFKIVNVAGRIKQIFKIAGFDTVRDIQDDFKTAVDSF